MGMVSGRSKSSSRSTKYQRWYRTCVARGDQASISLMYIRFKPGPPMGSPNHALPPHTQHHSSRDERGLASLCVRLAVIVKLVRVIIRLVQKRRLDDLSVEMTAGQLVRRECRVTHCQKVHINLVVARGQEHFLRWYSGRLHVLFHTLPEPKRLPCRYPGGRHFAREGCRDPRRPQTPRTLRGSQPKSPRTRCRRVAAPRRPARM